MGVTRRNFVAGAAALGAMAAVPAAALASETASDEAAAPLWYEKLDAIDEAAVTETVDCDVVVVGAGVCGIPAALTAVEEGARVVLLEKTVGAKGGPHWIGAIGSKRQLEAGCTYDRAAIVNDLMWHASYRADQRLIQLWFDNSGEMMDWYTSKLAEDGSVTVMIETAQKNTGGLHMSPPTAHVPVLGQWTVEGPNETGLNYAGAVLLEQAVAKGVDYREGVTAKEVIQGDDGSVVGLYAVGDDGAVIRVNAAKGVILCTGGYTANPAMCEQLNPVQFATTMLGRSGNTGDGIKMGVWAGGYLSDLHWWMDNDRGIPSGGIWRPGSQPWLRTDVYGNRFCNEDVPYDYGVYAGSLNPDHLWWDIFDDNYWYDLEQFGTTICSRMFPVEGAINSEQVMHSKEEFYEHYMAPNIEKGAMVTADTIEGLAEAMMALDDRIDPEILAATIARYNELCEKGVDEDFGKLPFRMQPVAQGPFYAILQCGVSICNLDGLRINTNVEVINDQGQPIKGLYAAGNDCGGFFGMSYPWYYGGLNCGMAITFARIAAKHACGRNDAAM